MSSSLVLRLLFGASIFALHAAGQNSQLRFNWKFENDATPQRVPICQDFPIVVIPDPKNATAGNFLGTPPYYMMSFPQGGQPITQLIGNTNDTLSWTPKHPVGTNFSLQLMDSDGYTGGDGGLIYQVVENPEGQDCAAPTPPNDFTITSNVTDGGRVETCHFWRLNINGGESPYKVVLNAVNSPVITNITVENGNDAVVYSNRADPDTTLFAGVVDNTGRWATGTQYISTFGSIDYACIGFRTIVTTQKELDDAEKAREDSQRSKKRTAIIVGIVVSVAGVLFIAGAIAFWIHRRRRLESLKPDIEPRQFMDSGPSGQVLSVTQFMASSPNHTPSSGKTAFSPIGSLPYSIEPFSDDRRDSTADQSQPHFHLTSSSGADQRGGPSFAQFPVSSVRRSGKAREAAQTTLAHHDRSQMSSSSARLLPDWPVRSASLQPPHHDSMSTSAMESEIIYQHQDAGQVVRELPPPYIPPHLQENSGGERSRPEGS
ncbi:hypothetical protein Agabi119p4_10269 [Agaricus bisporus var. burnettii]|uniref:Mid2 domain-containing protein n=1 Tax=Agaricus bisporus var. burnettii TaxID=192524 RepID=A0A8H7C2M3_AGABI|nr:hypothetical protein Agabi119p4_10269 [Agaricus bisporus var. burnettii]